MKKLLIITSSYYPKPTATGICIHRVVEVLKLKGYEVHIMCPRKYIDIENSYDMVENVSVYRVNIPFLVKAILYERNSDRMPEKLICKSAFIMLYLNLLVFLPVHPVKSFSYIWRYYRLASRLHRKNRYDGIIATYSSIESVISGTLMKRSFKGTPLGLYFLDSISNTVKGRFLPQHYLSKKGWKWERRLYKHADRIFNMKCHEKHHNHRRYAAFKHKMEIVDFPLLKEPEETMFAPDVKRGEYGLVYMGSLDSHFRHPGYVCALFEYINNQQYHVCFYSRGDMENLLSKYEKRTSGIIKRKGFLKHGESLKVMKQAQVLLSIGNSNSEMVPSKIFEYMATGKPVIHFYSDDNDSCLPYYSKYPLSLIIKQDGGRLKDNADRIIEFISNNAGKSLKFDTVKEIFPMNTPEYTAAMFDKMIRLNK